MEVVKELSGGGGAGGDERSVCVLCKRAIIDEVKLGPLYARDDVACHHYCLLFSSGLAQNGKSDKDGICRFLPVDIKKEVRRARLSKINCCFCKERGPSVGCCVKRCRNVWHYPCGFENGVNHQFFGNYEAYCPTHYKDMLPSKLKQRLFREKLDRDCPICFNSFTPNEMPVVGTCCKTSYFHKSCIQKTALSSGYFFKCPTCAKKEFSDDVKWQGVYVPEKDASWETVPNAYGELLQRYSHCDAVACKCPSGRDHGEKKGPWFLIRCCMCAAAGTHAECNEIMSSQFSTWSCGACRNVSSKVEVKRRPPAVPIPSKRNCSDDETDDDEPVDFDKLEVAERWRDYFPFTPEEISRFGKKYQELPDFKRKRLELNLVDCLPENVIASSAE